ncbi:MAG: AgmX/PglI C-terminal domain-containing protein [Labilithrix sp.]
MLIEARLSWDGDLLEVAHVPARGTVRVEDFGLPIPGDPREIVAEGGVLVRDRLDHLGVTARFSLTGASPLPRFALGDFRTTKGVALAALLHATVLAMAFIGRAAPYEDDGGRLAMMREYLAASDARVEGTLEPKDDLPPDSRDASRGGKQAGEHAGDRAGESGRSGRPTAPTTAGRSARANGDASDERQRDLREAREFGMIGLLGAPGGTRAGGADPFASFEGPSAVGSIFGATAVDSYGSSGGGLSGVGLGGGGKSGGIEIAPGLGGGGRCGASCTGSIGGFGSSHGRVTGAHATKAPVLRCGVDEVTKQETCTTQVSGRLPPEVVQRVVRQNFGRMRMCYEQGLVRNPSLEGRIAVKFVIDRSGAVAMASTADRTISDSEVASCVERAFRSMSFPEPEGGIVTVVYPLVLST